MIEVFCQDKHYDTIVGWFVGRGIEAPDKKDVLGFGLVVDGIVAGFAFPFGENGWQIDNLVSDPRSCVKARMVAWKTLFSEMEKECALDGREYLSVYLDRPRLIILARELGFCDFGSYTLLAKKVGG